jgi:hypothetical protein
MNQREEKATKLHEGEEKGKKMNMPGDLPNV